MPMFTNPDSTQRTRPSMAMNATEAIESTLELVRPTAALFFAMSSLAETATAVFWTSAGI
jgi:hypothetical protein